MSDDYQSIKVEQMRAAVQQSGLLEAVEAPQYLSAQSPDWRPYFAPSDDAAHPDFGRTVVTRKGQQPREVVISWGEYAAELALDDPQWAELRSAKPMAIFGAEVERHALRVVFPDVIAEAFPRVRAETQAPADPATAGEPKRHWRAEIAEADAAKLDELLDEARAAGAIAADPDLQGAFMDRLLQLEAGPKLSPAQVPAKKQAPRPQAQGDRRRGKR